MGSKQRSVGRNGTRALLALLLLAGGAKTAKAEVDGSSGTYSQSIPIEVPDFHGIEPHLSLTYSSLANRAAGNSWTGVGWKLQGIGRIERASPGGGAPKGDSTDIFLLEGMELIPCVVGSMSPSCTSGGTHSTKTESYAKITLTGTGWQSRWTIIDKRGTKNVYAPVFDQLTGPDGQWYTGDDQIFRWGISQVIDTKNNTVTYNWDANTWACCWEYPTKITYNGTTIQFNWEKRPDVWNAAAGADGFEVVQGRINNIDVLVGGSRLRKYQLAYTTSSTTGRSLLSSVQKRGKDNTTVMPAMTMGYQTGTTSFAAGTYDTGMAYNANAKYLPMDINGDGKTDVVELYVNGTSFGRRAWISNGTTFTSASDVATGIPYDTNSQFLTGDFNADGKSDFLEIYPNGSFWGLRTWISNGTGFTVGTTSNSTGAYAATSKFLAMDINADGKTDLLELYQNGTSFNRVASLSNGTGFTQASNDAGIPYNASSQFYVEDMYGNGKSGFVELYPGYARHWLSNGTGFAIGLEGAFTLAASDRYICMDVNGDGKTDVVHLTKSGAAWHRMIYLSTGGDFYGVNDDTAMWFSAGSQFLTTDVNGDGKEDLIELFPYGASFQRKIWRSTGGDFVLDGVDSVGSTAANSRFVEMDIDGNGLSDIVELTPAGAQMGRRVSTIGGPLRDLLSSFTNEFGGTTTVSYTPSTAWPNTVNPPMILPTVSSVTINDGRGGVATTSYTYSGLLYNPAERQSSGFRYAKETKPCIAGESSPCPYTETWYRQDLNAITNVERVDERTGTGTLLASTINEYTTNGTTIPRTALATGTWSYDFISGGAACPGVDCKRKYVSRAFNAYGEVTQVVDYGDYDVNGDERTTSIMLVPNTTAYVVDKPADIKVFQGVGTAGAMLHETVYYYDGATTWNQAPSAGFGTKSSSWLASPSSFVETSAEYDSWGNLTAVIDALGARTTFVYDATYHVFPTSTTNPLTQTTTQAWDVVCGQPTQSIDLNGQTTTRTYDALCRLATTTAPGGYVETTTWVNLGTPTTQYVQVNRPAADGTNNPLWSRRYIDGFSRTWRSSQKGPAAAAGDIYVDTAYNARSSVASQTAAYYWVSGQSQPTTYTTTNSYDALDRVTRVTFPDSAYQATSYGLWSVTNTDELGRGKTERFNARGQRVAHDETVAGMIRTATYLYDARGNLQESTDPFGNKITYVTDSLGRTTQVTDPNWGISTYEYDGAGRRTATTDAKSQRTTFGYDALGRKTSKTTNAGTPQAATVSWAYDQARATYYNVGGLTTVTDGAGTKTLDYDVAGRLVRAVRTIDGTGYTSTYGYDTSGRTKWTTYPDGDTLGTTGAPLVYNSAGQLKSIPGYVTSAVYNAAGSLTQINDVNGTVTTRVYSAQRGWITGITTMAGATTIQNLAYTRNAKGMVTAVTSPIDNEGWTYTKDELDRLTVASNTSSSTYDQTLAYDEIGNITSDSTLGSYTYDATKKHAVTAAGGNTYAYDAAGLMTSGAGRTMTWNGDNRLASVTRGGVTSTMTYDADGQRIQQVEGGTTRRYLGDDYEIDVGGGSSTKYVSLAGVPIARKDGSSRYWLHTDQLGSIQAETDASGVEVHRKTYRPYGDILSSSGSHDDEPRGYTAQRHDASGLVYLHARYYDPTLGRFISPDFVIDGPDTIGLNRYAYVGNNPIDATDVEGLAASKPNVKNGNKVSPKTKAPSSNNSKGQNNSKNNPSLAAAKNTSSANMAAGGKVNAQQTSIVRDSKTGVTTMTTCHCGPGLTQAPAGPLSMNIDGSATKSEVIRVRIFVPPPPPPPPQYVSSAPVPAPAPAAPPPSTGWWAPPVRQYEVQLMSKEIPFPANGPLGDDDDIEDQVFEMWADLMRGHVGESEWDSRFGDGS